MCQFFSFSNRICRTAILLVAALVLSSSSAFAMAHYRVWYFDDVYESFNEGDVSDGTTKLTPTSWACGLKFDNPSYYRWVNGYGSTMSSGNLSKDVYVWMPLPGCPENEPLIEYHDGSHTFAHPPGASYMEISTHDGVYWIDEDGGWPSCHPCNAFDDFQYVFNPIDWDIFENSVATLKTLLLNTRGQTRLAAPIAQARSSVSHLTVTFTATIQARRRTPLADREATVRSLEDAAARLLVSAEQRLSVCGDAAKTNQFPEAYAACDGATLDVQAARSAAIAAQHFMGIGTRLSAGGH
jgi:hypothetical protein